MKNVLKLDVFIFEHSSYKTMLVLESIKNKPIVNTLIAK